MSPGSGPQTGRIIMPDSFQFSNEDEQGNSAQELGDEDASHIRQAAVQRATNLRGGPLSPRENRTANDHFEHPDHAPDDEQEHRGSRNATTPADRLHLRREPVAGHR